MKSAGWMDRFLPLPENRSALLAVQRLADGGDVDAVYLHGPSGSGKTHLAHLLLELLRDRTAACVSAREEFASGSNCPDGDLLIVEDVQFLPEGGVERFVDLLDRRQGRATLVTGNAGPGTLRHRGQRLPARLTSRLAAGLVVSVAPPGPASRRLVLDRWLADHRFEVAPEIVDWLARKARGLRAFESAVGQIALLRKMSDKAPGVDSIREHLEKHLDADRPSVDRIAGHVAGHYRVPAKELRSRSRRRAVLVPRHVSMYLTRQLTPMSFQQIGSYFGGCDHSTVLYACRKVEEALGEDAVLSGTVRQLHDELC
jgi:chromosomal replication initiator protein